MFSHLNVRSAAQCDGEVREAMRFCTDAHPPPSITITASIIDCDDVTSVQRVTIITARFSSAEKSAQPIFGDSISLERLPLAGHWL